MIPTQVFASFRIVLITFVISLNVFIISASYDKNWDLLWLLPISVPLLFLAIYKLNRKKHPVLHKYFLGQKLNAIHANHEWFTHPDSSIKIAKNELSITIGNDNCTQPYRTCIYNIRVKGSLKKRAGQKIIKELPAKDDKEAFSEDTHMYHLIGGEKILQIGPEYSGCQTERGGFDAIKFKKSACRDSVKMVELNLLPDNSDIVNDSLNLSTLGFTVFSDAEGMIHFLDTLHQLSGRKPIGIRICISNKKEFYRICHAIVKTRVIPDYFIVEGADTRPGRVTNFFEMSLYEALLFVSKTLQIYGLDKNIKIIALADVISGLDILKILALGANAVCSEIPDYKIIKYHAKEFLMDKSQDIANFHEGIINATLRIMEANRFKSIADITLAKILQSLDVFFAKNQLETYNSREKTGSPKNSYESGLKVNHITN